MKATWKDMFKSHMKAPYMVIGHMLHQIVERDFKSDLVARHIRKSFFCSIASHHAQCSLHSDDIDLGLRTDPLSVWHIKSLVLESMADD